MRKILFAAGLVVLLTAGSVGVWLQRSGPEILPFGPLAPEEGSAALPVPPVPPRLATGDQYEQCLTMIDADPEGANGFAEAWESAGGSEPATHCRALALVALGEAETGARLLDQIAAHSTAPPLIRAQIYGQAVQAWMMTDETDRALASVNAALALHPDDPDLLIDRAVAATTLEHFADAIADLDRALVIDPGRYDALVLRAAARRQQGELGKAKDDVDHALQIDPDYAEALLERGILRQRMGDSGGARGDWERVIELDPDSPTADLAQQNLALLEVGPAR